MSTASPPTMRLSSVMSSDMASHPLSDASEALPALRRISAVLGATGDHRARAENLSIGHCSGSVGIAKDFYPKSSRSIIAMQLPGGPYLSHHIMPDAWPACLQCRFSGTRETRRQGHCASELHQIKCNTPTHIIVAHRWGWSHGELPAWQGRHSIRWPLWKICRSGEAPPSRDPSWEDLSR